MDVLCRVLRRGPHAVAHFLAEVSELPAAYRARRAQLRTDSYRRQTDGVDARLDLLDRRIKAWYAHVAAEQLWTDHQELLNVGGEIQARMIDEDGNQIPERPIVLP